MVDEVIALVRAGGSTPPMGPDFHVGTTDLVYQLQRERGFESHPWATSSVVE